MGTLRGSWSNAGLRSGRWRPVGELAVLVLALGLASGCGLFKKSNAVNPGTLSTLGSFAATLEATSSNYVRNSGSALLARLSGLFPQASVGPSTATAPPDIAYDQFQILTATGLDKTLATDDRSTSAVPQKAFRDIASQLCKNFAVASPPAHAKPGDRDAYLQSHPNNYGMFSEATAFTADDSLPSDTATRLALTVLRNTWLAPISSADPEVAELAGLYTTMTQTLGASADEGRQAICEAALLTPQFQLGTEDPSDKLRKISIELAHVIPTMSDLKAFAAGNLDISQYVQKLQTEPQYRSGYIASISAWHSDWLGLRPFGVHNAQDPRRSNAIAISRAGTPGFDYQRVFGAYPASAHEAANPLQTDTASVVVPRLHNAAYYNTYNQGMEWIDPTLQNQPFDPRTLMIAWETYNPLPAKQGWQLVGAFVANDPKQIGLNHYRAMLSAYLSPGQVNAAVNQCRPMLELSSTYKGYLPGASNLPFLKTYGFNRLNFGFPNAPPLSVSSTFANSGPSNPTDGLSYFQCPGLVSLNDLSGFNTTSIHDIIALYCRFNGETPASGAAQSAIRNALTAVFGNAVCQAQTLPDGSSTPTAGTWSTVPNGLTGTVGEYWPGPAPSLQGRNGNLRVRRLAPGPGPDYKGVWQDGTSAAESWYSGVPIQVPNTLTRYHLTCLSRPTARITFDQQPPTDSSMRADAGMGYLWGSSIANFEWIMHPGVLNHFRCGVPNLAALPPPSPIYPDTSIYNDPYGMKDTDPAVATYKAWQYLLTPLNTTAFSVYPGLNSIYGFTSLYDYFSAKPQDNPKATNLPPINEEAVYPHGGFTLDSWSSYLSPSVQVSSLINNGFFTADPTTEGIAYDASKFNNALGEFTTINSDPQAQGPDATGAYAEELSLRNLADDLNNEPLNLLSYILIQGRPYKELYTAKYTWGRDELELFYRSQAYYLPTWPQGFTPQGPNTGFHLIEFSSFAPINVHEFRMPNSWDYCDAADYSLYGGGHSSCYDFYLPSLGIATSGRIDPKPVSGILTMPAFLGPVGQKMRTVVARIFTRLLCGMPSDIPLTADQDALHKQYMATASNPFYSQIAKTHLNSSTACFTCHRHIDPMAAGLSQNFLRTVGTNMEEETFSADFVALPQFNVGLVSSSVFGVRNGMNRSVPGADPMIGAALGQTFSGWEQLGQILTNSRYFESCVVRQTAEHMLGRPLGISDARTFNQLTDSFHEKDDYNELVREIAASKLWDGGR